MSYVILDLEWNGTYSKAAHKFVNEIIEFGALKLNDALEITDSFSALVAPKIGKKMNTRVKALTKINFEELKDKGVSFDEASSRFAVFLGDSVLLTWGTSDLFTLMENYTFYTKDYHIPFLTSYCDLQEFCERAMGIYDEGNQIGLGTCAERLGIAFSEEEQHRADADAYLSLECMKRNIAAYPIGECILDARSEAFYERLTFKNHFLTSLSDPAVDKEELKFSCDRCGSPAKRQKKWKMHNKHFTTEFYCRQCRRRFIGRISFKQKYDSVVVNKRILEMPEKVKKSVEPKPELKPAEAPRT